MDEIVKAALRKWPHVPACFDWLALDARGQWYMRDERTQAAGPFPQVKGSRVDHEKLREFIERNYEADADGAWYFQNGPQRVYVTLEAAPWVWRVGEGPEHRVTSHTGRPVAQVHEAVIDEAGRLFLRTDLGAGLVHSLDMLQAAAALESQAWGPEPVREVEFAGLPRAWGYELRPQPR